MDGRAFLDVARDLAAMTTEAHWRAAGVSAYYALMLEARDALQHWGFPTPPRANVHAFVRLTYSYAAHPDLKKIGDALDDLVQLRNEGHYQIRLSGQFASNQRVVRAIASAGHAIALLDQIEADATRQAAAIAAIRAGGS